MNEQNEAPEAPASAVEQGATSQDASASSNQDASASSSQPATASSAQAASAASSENSEGQSAPESDAGESDAEEGEGGEGAEEGAAADGQAPGEPGKKKRRRRRRKKGPGAQAAGEGVEGAPDQAQGGEPRERGPRPERPAKEGSAGIYARFFEGASATKRHAFTAGEVVAGRVSAINDGAFAVDLFGKATAFVDIFEPREVPVIPDPPPETAAAEATTETAVESAAEAPAEAPAEAAAEAPATEVVTDGANVEGARAEAAVVADDASQAVAESVSFAPISEAPAVPVDVEAASAEAHPHADEHHAEPEHAEPEPEPEAPPAPELGAIFRGRIGSVAESGHVVIVNRIIDVPAAKKRLEGAREARRRVRGVVFGFNRGGFDVMVEGIRVFCPASGMSLAPLENPEEVLGQRLEFTLPPTKAGTHGFVVSRRGIIERQQRKAAKALFKSLQPGQRLKGVVTHVRDFGVFVDLGGIEGLVHQSELSFNRGVRPSDVAKSGDEVEVQVLRVGEGPTRRDRERVSLSMKALQDDPWSAHGDVLEPGSVHTGKVTRTTDFGAFIELVPNIEGLLHISELGRELKHANQAVQEGQELRVVVERVDRKLRRISLSRLSASEEKAMAEGEAEGKSGKPPKIGAHVTVVVEKVEPMGLIVQFPGVFGRRGRGFIPNSEMGTERGTDHRKGFAPGTQIPVKVVAMDRDGGLRCSRKLLLVEEEKRAVQDYRREAARHGLGTFGDLLRAKLEGKQPT